MLKDKIVFITGASSGIGEACAKQFAKAGAHLLLCARRIERLNDLAQQIQQTHAVKVYPLQLDVTQNEKVMDAFHTLPNDWKNIDILINNAGLALGLDFFQEGNLDDWERMIDTNVKGLLYITKAVLPHMLKRKIGHIINLGSVAGHEVYPKGAVYCASKFAVDALTKGLRLDLNGSNIRVSAIDPGAVETNFSKVRFKGNAERAAAVYEGIQALTANDIAETILYCASRPAHINISELTILPTAQASATLIARNKKQE